MRKHHRFGGDGKHVPEKNILICWPVGWSFIYLDKIELMSVPGSLGKWICIVHDSIEHTIFKKWCSFFPLTGSWYNWNRNIISDNCIKDCTWMWLSLLPDVQSSKNTFIAFNDVVFSNIVCLKLSCWNGHTETNFQNFTALKYWI